VVAVFFRVVIMWLYNGAGRSVLIVALLHSAFNSVTGPQEATRFVRELVAGPAALMIGLAVVAMVAMLVTVFTKGRLAYEPERATARPSPEPPAVQPASWLLRTRSLRVWVNKGKKRVDRAGSTPVPPSWRCSELSYTSRGEGRDGRAALPGSCVIMAGLRRD
jgi:hypothetical protein